LTRITAREVLLEVIQSFTNSKGLIHLISILILKPGVVAREYVEGKRKRYFAPFSFLILMVGMSSLLIGESAMISQHVGSKVSVFGKFMDRHANLVIFLGVPILAFFNWLLFRNGKFNYAENLVLAAFTSGQKSIFFSVFIAPAVYFFPNYYSIIIGIYVVFWICYFTWANLQFLHQTGYQTIIKSLLIPLLTQLTTIAILATWILVYFGKQGLK